MSIMRFQNVLVVFKVNTSNDTDRLADGLPGDGLMGHRVDGSTGLTSRRVNGSLGCRVRD